MWWLSLLGTIGAAIGVVIGVVKLGVALRDKTWPYHGLQAWHHALGLIFAPFILMWIFSGFLSLGDSWPLKSLHTLDFAPLDTHPLLRTCRDRRALPLRPRVQPHRRGAGVAQGANQRMTGMEAERRTNRARMIESSLY